MTTARALCATEIRWTGDLWFSTDPADRAQAKRICARCPLQPSCAQAGLDLGGGARGVWGGLSSGDRRVLRTGVAGPDPDDEGDDSPRVSERRPCGDEAAYLGHRHFGEECEECQAAHDVHVEARRRARLEEEHAKGGTGVGKIGRAPRRERV